MKTTTPRQAKAQLDSDQRTVYLDVRTVREFEAGHPEGALNIPVAMPGAAGVMQLNPDFVRIVSSVLDSDAPILCGCQSGGRSAMAAKLLGEAGFGDVANVLGGFGGGSDPQTGEPITGWRDEGLPVATKASEGASYTELRERAEQK